jgi:hypothetical protein
MSLIQEQRPKLQMISCIHVRARTLHRLYEQDIKQSLSTAAGATSTAAGATSTAVGATSTAAGAISTAAGTIPMGIIFRYLRVEDHLSEQIQEGKTLKEEVIWRRLRWKPKFRQQCSTLYELYTTWLEHGAKLVEKESANVYEMKSSEGEFCNSCKRL